MKLTDQGWAVLEDDTHISRWVEETGQIDHGMELVKTWQNYIPWGGVAVDVGANIGDTTIPMADLVGMAGQVYAYEPNSRAFECLSHNLVQGGVDLWTVAYQQAVGEVTTTAWLRLSPNAGASHITSCPESLFSPVQVDIVRLDDKKLQYCDFIKIDVEGIELQVLTGAEETIKRCRPILYIEIAVHCDRYGIQKTDILQWLLDRDYHLSHLFNEVRDAPQLDITAIPNERAPEFCD
jgi:FkbM family methyltransferase